MIEQVPHDLISQAALGRAVQHGAHGCFLPEHDNRLSAAEQALFEGITPGMRATPFDPPWVRDHAATLGEPETAVRTVLNRAAKRGLAYQVVRDLFYHPQSVRELADLAAELQQAAGSISATAFRDRTGLGRKRAIQILEYFDRLGYTRRVGDVHHLRGDALRRIGVEAPSAGDTEPAPEPGGVQALTERLRTTA
jgi:selenocysteine-specific elongation factor